MQDESTTITVGLRFWSDAFSLKAMASCFPGKVEYVYDAGEPTRLPSGELSTRKAPRHYLALKEYETHEPASVPALIKQCLTDLWRDSYVAMHVQNTPVEAVLWIAVFGAEKTDINALGIESETFGEKIGLVVENYTSINEAGQPERWLIEAGVPSDMLNVGGGNG